MKKLGLLVLVASGMMVGMAAIEVKDAAWDMTAEVGKFRGSLCKIGYENEKITVKPEGHGLCRVDWNSRPGVQPSPKLRAVEVTTVPAFSRRIIVHLADVHTKAMHTVRSGIITGETARVAVDLPTTNLYQIVYVEFQDGAEKWLKGRKEFMLKSVMAVSEQPEGAALRLDVDTGNDIHVTDYAKPKAEATLTNHSQRKIKASGRLEYRGFLGSSIDIPVAAELKAGETMRFATPKLAEKGHWRITAVLTGEDGIETRQETAFASVKRQTITPKIPLGQFRYGMNVHSPRYTAADRKRVLDALVWAGVKLVRLGGTSFYEVCPRKYVYDFADADSLVNDFESRGIAMQMNIYTTAREWAVEPDVWKRVPNRFKYAAPPKPEIFEEFAAMVAFRYGTRIDYYEMGNEWDLLPEKAMTSDEAIRNLKAGYAGVKRGCPKALMTTPGFACPCDTPLVSQKGFLDRVLDGAKGHFDVQCSHNHGYIGNFEQYEGGEMLKTREKHGLTGVPWFPNETALCMLFGSGKAWMPVPEHVFMKIITAQAFGACDYCWYVLRATGTDPADTEQMYGTMTADFYPRPSYAAFAALTEVYTGLKYKATEFKRYRRRVYRFEGEDTIAFAAWDNAGGNAKIKVKTDAKRAEQIDLMGNVHEVEIVDGTATFTIGFSPVTWKLTGASMAQIDEKDIANGAQERQKVMLIPPGEKYDEKHPQSNLNYNFQVVNFYHGNPLTKHRIWTGSDDLSARLWVRREGEWLKLKVVAKDDKHVQGEDAAKLWQHDGIQLGFNVPGEATAWKIGLALSGEGKPLKTVWNAPKGADKAEMEEQMKLTVAREGNVVTYEAKFPLKTLGYDYTRLRNGVKFNLIINDDDGEGRDGWIQVADGLGDNYNHEPWPILKFNE